MRYVKLPVNKQRTEIVWQIADAAALAAVASVVVALFLNSLVAGGLLFVSSVTSVAAYLLIELQLEQANVKFSHHTHSRDPLMQDSRINVLLWGVIIGVLAIGNFLLYFVRHGVTASEIPTTAPLYREAVILAGLTIIACLLARILHHRFHFSRKLKLKGTAQARHLKAYILSFVYTFAVVYIVILLSPYGANISFVLPVIVVYLGLREFQRFDRKHHRRTLAELHRQATANTK